MTIEYKIIFDENGVTVRQTIDESGIPGKGGSDGKETGPGGDGRPTGPGSGGPIQAGAAVVFGPTIIGAGKTGGARVIPKVVSATEPKSPAASAAAATETPNEDIG